MKKKNLFMQVPINSENRSGSCSENAGFRIVRDKFLHRGFCTSETRILGPNSAKRIWDARISDPNSWVEFFGPIFSRKRGPLKNSPSRNSPPRNSPSKIQPRNRAKKFTLHLCRATWLMYCSSRESLPRTKLAFREGFGVFEVKLLEPVISNF